MRPGSPFVDLQICHHGTVHLHVANTTLRMDLATLRRVHELLEATLDDQDARREWPQLRLLEQPGSEPN